MVAVVARSSNPGGFSRDLNGTARGLDASKFALLARRRVTAVICPIMVFARERAVAVDYTRA